MRSRAPIGNDASHVAASPIAQPSVFSQALISVTAILA
ncbi:hemin uptake protein HemP [Bradyrhizobium sp. USDA 4532]|nr:hemin uptake protein HemP [Bradyrhizobium sp. USDA 4545]MCP1916241.1 hemin uptake protein HemP [Bradyrhizobium elkanii]MCP1918173.1 hemin uptake protein HemP [Bradyrhizobium sp. USDA 4532]